MLECTGLGYCTEELGKLAHDHNPDFIVITETKLRNTVLGRQHLAAALPVTDCTLVAKRMVAAPATENAQELQEWPLQCTGD